MEKLISNISSIHQEAGKTWLNSLPTLSQEICKKFGLSKMNPIKNMSHNYIMSGFKGKTPVILKIGIDIESLKKEALALKAFQGFGAVKILGELDGALLIKRAMPGTKLDTNDIETACKVMKRLHDAPVTNHEFPHISDWLKVLDKGWNVEPMYLEKARSLRNKLLNNSAKQVLLHGDLHHENILKNVDEWSVIDPKGVIGAPINEVWKFIRDMENDTAFIASFFGFDLQEVREWYFVQLVMSSCWNLEDKITPNIFEDLYKKAFKMLV